MSASENFFSCASLSGPSLHHLDVSRESIIFTQGFDKERGGFIASEATRRVRYRQQLQINKDDMETSPNSSALKIGPEICDEERYDQDSVWAILKQVSLPFFIAGAAMVLAGLYFDLIQDWPAFKNVPEIIVLVPALLGLKGNLEMTLAARLSTEANLGLMNNSKDHVSIISGNIALVQLQAIVIAILTCTCGSILIMLEGGDIIPEHILMLYACCITTASLASLLLAMVTGLIIILAVYCKINPDNVATPIAASLGDITSILLISVLATSLYKTIDNDIWISVLIIIGYILLLPVLFWLAKTNPHTANVVSSGWIPVILAMLISTVAGISLKNFMARYRTLPAFQPVMNGVGGNLVSIQASRLSTTLHMKSHLGDLPENTPIVISPLRLFYAKDSYAVTSRVLLSLAVPGHILFAAVILLVRTTFPITLSLIFLVMYLVAALSQVFILLYSAYILTHCVWKWNINPDTTTIPYLTAIGDFLGIVFLGASYSLLEYLGLKDLL